MRSVDFFEFAGIVVPGAVLLFALGLFVETGPAERFLTPDGVGNTVVYLVLAYVTGHLVQAVANAFEWLYWKIWSGMPTDWPITRQGYSDSPAWRGAVESVLGESSGGDVKKWRQMVRQARSTVYASNRGSRVNVFNANYDMFRGLVVVQLITAVFAWQGPFDAASVYSALAVASALTIYRMHRFAVNYARELFAAVATLARGNREMKGGKGEP